MAFGDFTVVRSTVKNVLNSSGLLAQVAINTPAFEFNADGTYKGLLVEPSATNLALRSREFDNGYWTKTRLNTTGTPAFVDVAVAPDGTTTAEKIIANTDSNTHAITRTITIATATKHTYSVFAKAGEYGFLGILGSNPGQGKFFDLVNGTVLGDFIATPDSATIENYGSGWYRCSITTTSTSTSTVFQLYVASTGTTATFTGDDTSGIFIWQAQLETGSVATSPIYTVASTVTRTADDISLASASSLIGQTEGTVYVSTYLRPQTIGRRVIGISDGTAAARLGVTIASISQIPSAILNGNIALISSAAIVTEGVYKFCITYTASKVAFFRNGVKIGEVATSGSGAYTDVDLGQTELSASQLNDNISAYWNGPTAISDAQAIALTTL